MQALYPAGPGRRLPGGSSADPAPMFELTLSDLARLVGLRYPLRP